MKTTLKTVKQEIKCFQGLKPLLGKPFSLKNYQTNKHRKTASDMDTATRVQILDLTDCISHSTNSLGKGMNPNILPLAMGK